MISFADPEKTAYEQTHYCNKNTCMKVHMSELGALQGEAFIHPRETLDNLFPCS